jgi:hypothetical protein
MTGFCSPPFTILKGGTRRAGFASHAARESQQTEITRRPKAAIFLRKCASD